MKYGIAAALGAAALFVTPVSAAPLMPSTPSVNNGIEQVRLICNTRGHCWESRRRARTVVIERDSYGYSPRRGYVEERRYYDRPRPGVGVGVETPIGGVGVGVRSW
jgi:hypothetical protein